MLGFCCRARGKDWQGSLTLTEPDADHDPVMGLALPEAGCQLEDGG